MAQRMDDQISAFEFSIIKDCFRQMVSEGLPEHRWVYAVEDLVGAITGSNGADPELIVAILGGKPKQLKRRFFDKDRLDRADRESRHIMDAERISREAKTFRLREQRLAFQALLSPAAHTLLKSTRKMKLSH
ncbi:hypothetical protein [Mesorhizobium sp. 128a]